MRMVVTANIFDLIALGVFALALLFFGVMFLVFWLTGGK